MKLTVEEMAYALQRNEDIPCPKDSKKCFGALENCTQCFIDNLTADDIKSEYAKMIEGKHEQIDP